MASPVGTPPNQFLDPEMASGSKDIVSSSEASQPGSRGEQRKGKKRVGFFGGGDSGDGSRKGSWIFGTDGTATPPVVEASERSTPVNQENVSPHTRNESVETSLPHNISKSHLPEITRQQTQEIYDAFNQPAPKPRPAIRKTASSQPALGGEDIEVPDNDGQQAHRRKRAEVAHERGKQLEEDQRSQANSRYNSPERPAKRKLSYSEDVPMDDLGGQDDGQESEDEAMPTLKRSKAFDRQEAERLFRMHTQRRKHHGDDASIVSEPRSGAVTPTDEQDEYEDYRPRPNKFRGGIFGTILSLYGQTQERMGTHSRSSSMTNLLQRKHRGGDFSASSTPQHSPPDSGTVTPNGGSPLNWFSRKHPNGRSSPSLTHLVSGSASMAAPAMSDLGEQVSQRMKEQKEHKSRPKAGRRHSSGPLATLERFTRHRDEEEIRIKDHIAETLTRQKYLQLLCRALMLYGAPTHRLEEYMRMSSRVLEMDAQFLYIPGSMIMSFDDPATHTTEVKLVKTAQGIDLGKLRDVHDVYKEVLHDNIWVSDAMQRLREIISRKDKFKRWFRVPIYGLAAVCVGPFAFQARLIDLPIAFILGSILGVLQLYVAAKSDLYANVFEVVAAVVTSFLARAFGSIPNGDGKRLFCFSALAQSSIALILPGYIVLCASLELQSRSIVAGSVRMVYAIIYSLFLGFGITIGTAIYGIIDQNATSETTCADQISTGWYFLFVPGFTLCLIIINQAKWKQAPVMLVIAMVGYIVNFYSSQRFAGNTQVSNTLGALAIGVLANLYSRTGSRVENWALDVWEYKLIHYWNRFRRVVFSTETGAKSAKILEEGEADSSKDEADKAPPRLRRVGYSLAAAAMLPAIFVQVPSGLAVSGSLVSGLASANQIAGNATNGTAVVNTTTLSTSSAAQGLNSLAFNVSYSVVQVAIGITVGLFLSAIVVYPVGKRRSGLFSF